MTEFNLRFEKGQTVPQEVKDKVVELLRELEANEQEEGSVPETVEPLSGTVEPTWYFAYKT